MAAHLISRATRGCGGLDRGAVAVAVPAVPGEAEAVGSAREVVVQGGRPRWAWALRCTRLAVGSAAARATAALALRALRVGALEAEEAARARATAVIARPSAEMHQG